MSITLVNPKVAPVVDEVDVLVAARGFADQIADAELGLLCTALEWVHHNPGWFMVEHQSMWYSSDLADLALWQEIADDGCALVDDMSLPEFGYAIGQSTTVVRSLVHDAVVMFYRFPRTWARMVAGQVPVWRARLVPRLASRVSPEVADYVDRHVNQPGARLTRPQVQRVIDEARLRYEPDVVQAELEAEQERRQVEIDLASGAHVGLADLSATLDLVDARDLEAAIAYGAQWLKRAGSTEPLHVRRAHALGDLARGAQVPSTKPFPDQRVAWDGTGVPKTGVQVHIHLNHTALRCECGDSAPLSPGMGGAARVDITGCAPTVLPPKVIREWFTRPGASDSRAGPKVTVRPVIDPQDYMHTEAYEVPERTRSAVTALHGRTCVFPFCQANAARADCDHITPYDEGGPTCLCNLAPLCRYHHRVKTHGQHHTHHRWRYAPVGHDTYVWNGPNGIWLLRGPQGTHVVEGSMFTDRPHDHHPTPGVLGRNGALSGFDEDHPAFAVVTDPDALPQRRGDGTPKALANKTLVDKARRRRRRDPFSPFAYLKYAARGRDLKRPKVVYAKVPGEQAQKQRWERITQALRRQRERNRNMLRGLPYPEEDRTPVLDDHGPPPF
ncbi:MAG TPA: hypothetical protein VK054_02300 [Beutenbergiaceae bacterium]|nr:hypothetical protein [Beutenbergiaceae bacterium]